MLNHLHVRAKACSGNVFLFLSCLPIPRLRLLCLELVAFFPRGLTLNATFHLAVNCVTRAMVTYFRIISLFYSMRISKTVERKGWTGLRRRRG